MAAYTLTTVVRAGGTPTTNACSSSDTVAITPGYLLILWFTGGAGSDTVTVTDSGLTAAGNAGVSQTVVVPSGATSFKTVYVPTSAQNTSTAAVTIAHSAPTGVAAFCLQVAP
jgi:hypothetical protein